MPADIAPAKTWPGVVYAVLIIASWAALHVYGVFFLSLSAVPIWVIVGIVLLQVWLYAGMFIVAHDTMHGSFLPGRPKLNAVIGQIILTVYAGFNWKYMRKAHHRHHDTPGTADDPDFNADGPTAFWAWYYKWFRTYFGWKQFAFLFVVSMTYQFVLKAALPNILVFWALPAIASSLQLFYFGTYLPHRHAEAFPDAHNARTNNFSRPISLLTCFHFGYHHEHHLFPQEPWWRLPKRRFAK